MRAMRRAAVVVAATMLGPLLGAPTAWTQGSSFESTPSFTVDVRIEPRGDLLVTETIEQDFGSTERHGIIRYVPDRLRFDDRYDRVYPIDLLSVSASAGTPADVETSSESGTFVIRIGDPDRTITGRHTYTVVYRVEGVMNGFPDRDELYWNAIGDRWEQPVGRMRVSVEGPGPITRTACYQGPLGSATPCDRQQVRNGVATFLQTDLGSYTAMSVVVAMPPGTVRDTTPILDERWDLGRAFSVTAATVAGSAGMLALVVGGFSWLMWRRGRDRRFRGSPIDQVMGGPDDAHVQAVPLFERGEAPVEFAPPQDLLPGQVGTLIDERANTLDVTATIVDLAVRGFLVIEEIPKTWFLGKPDWKLTRLGGNEGELLPYERTLLRGLFEDGDEVLLSGLKTRFATRLEKVRDDLYRDVVSRKWFTGRPDKIRGVWTGIGIATELVGIGATVALAAFSHAGLLGIPLVVGGLLLIAGAHRMPARTAKGTAMTRRIRGFRRVIETAEEHTARWAEQENVFTRFLPYAVVFDVTDKWAKAFEGLGQVPSAEMSWYVSARPFVLTEFTDSMGSFAVTTSGIIASTPAGSGGSGFGGGGSAGGGAGGGGGGSW